MSLTSLYWKGKLVTIFGTLGAKGSYVRVNGPTVTVDSVDVALEDVDLWKAEALLGYQF